MRTLIVAMTVLVFTLASSAYGQQPTAPASPRHPTGQAQTPAPPPQPGGAMPMMDMCQQMMGGQSMMGGGMTAGGMMAGPQPGGSQPMDPKMMAQMMEMRGEMMKAMGDIMMKHAQTMKGSRTE